jgi:hypothetical protein
MSNFMKTGWENTTQAKKDLEPIMERYLSSADESQVNQALVAQLRKAAKKAYEAAGVEWPEGI